MIRVRPCSPPPARPLSQGLLQHPSEQNAIACPLLDVGSSSSSMETIKRVLGTKEVRCFARRDGLASAYCGSGSATAGASENDEALLIARHYGIPIPNEALPLTGSVLFLGPAVGNYSNL